VARLARRTGSIGDVVAFAAAAASPLVPGEGLAWRRDAAADAIDAGLVGKYAAPLVDRLARRTGSIGEAVALAGAAASPVIPDEGLAWRTGAADAIDAGLVGEAPPSMVADEGLARRDGTTGDSINVVLAGNESSPRVPAD
jgi:hypothetical protein